MHSNMCAAVSTLLLSVPTSPFFFTGDFTHHRAAGTNECASFHAQSQHTLRALGDFYQLRYRKARVGAQGSRCHWPTSMEDPGAGPRNKGHSRYGFAGTGSTGHWCYSSRVRFLLISCLFFFLSGKDLFTVGNCTRLDRRCPTSPPSTLSLQL